MRAIALRLFLLGTLFAATVHPGPAQAQSTPHPALVVLNKDANELAIVNPQSLQVVGRVPTGDIPHEVAVSDDGKLAVATNYGPGMKGTTLTIIDLDAQKGRTFSLLNVVGSQGEKYGDLIGPHGVQFFDGKFYFTAEGTHKIARYNPANDKVDLVVPIDQNRTHMLIVLKRVYVIFTSNVNSNSVTAVWPNRDGGDWNHTTIPVGKGPEAIDASPDNTEVWVGNSGDGTVSIINPDAKKVTETSSVGAKHSNRLKFTPDGKFVYVSDMGTGDLVVVDAKSRKVVNRVKLGSSAEGILMQPDGSRIYVAVSGDNKVVIVDPHTQAVINSIATGKDPDGMAWRP